MTPMRDDTVHVHGPYEIPTEWGSWNRRVFALRSHACACNHMHGFTIQINDWATFIAWPDMAEAMLTDSFEHLIEDIRTCPWAVR